GDEEFVTGDIASCNCIIERFAQCFFILVERCGIKMAVAYFNSLTDNLDALVIAQLVRSKANLWDLTLIIRRRRRYWWLRVLRSHTSLCALSERGCVARARSCTRFSFHSLDSRAGAMNNPRGLARTFAMPTARGVAH